MATGCVQVWADEADDLLLRPERQSGATSVYVVDVDGERAVITTVTTPRCERRGHRRAATPSSARAVVRRVDRCAGGPPGPPASLLSEVRDRHDGPPREAPRRTDRPGRRRRMRSERHDVPIADHRRLPSGRHGPPAQVRCSSIPMSRPMTSWRSPSSLASPAVDIKAITVSGTGEAHCDAGVDVVLRLLERLDAPTIDVACGRETPIAGDLAFPDAWRAQCRRRLRARAALDVAAAVRRRCRAAHHARPPMAWTGCAS